MRALAPVTLLAAVLVVGCGRPDLVSLPEIPPLGQDSGTTIRPHYEHDGGSVVEPVSDGGSAWDAGEVTPDAGMKDSDAGAQPDAGAPPDAGLPADAGTEDGGFTAEIEVMNSRLPRPLHEPSVVWDGTQIWVFGGMTAQSTFSTQILRYLPGQDVLLTTSTALPQGRQASAAVWTGQYVFLIGGRSSVSALLEDILRFDPSTGAITTMNAKLPTGRYNVGTVWDGQYIYIFGGFDYTYLSEVLRYDPVADVLTTVSAAIPGVRESPVAVRSAGKVFLVGGHTGTAARQDIVEFTPSPPQMASTGSTLPYGAVNPEPLWINGSLYLYGGSTPNWAPIWTVSRFTPATGDTRVSSFNIPFRILGRGSASTGASGYIFGGYDPVTGDLLDTIIRFTP